MTLSLFLSIGYKVFPRSTQSLQELRHLRREAGRLREILDRASSLPEKVEILLSTRLFSPSQKQSEFLQLLMAIERLGARRICEIGGANGGSLAGFCEVATPGAQLLSIDIRYSMARRYAHRHLARGAQRIACWAADSHDLDLPARVRRFFGDQPLDFLLIDGDHSLEGVTQDYRRFAPLVRPGGLIAFHDIVPDSWMRSGVRTSSVVGGVPLYWQELKSQTADAIEFVADPLQDGYGIGLIRVRDGESGLSR